MTIAHLGSLQLGDGGLLFLDDRGYVDRAGLLAAAWREGAVIDPSAFNYAGTYQFGYPALLGGAFTLVGNNVLAAKLINVLAGTATVLITGLLAGRVLGEQSRRRAAWAAALFPTLVWWSAPLMKEAVTTLLVVGLLLAVTYIPRCAAVAATAAVCAALVPTRTSAAVAVLAGGATALGLAAWRSSTIQWRHWLRVAAGVSCFVLIGLLLLSRGDLHALTLQYGSTIEDMVKRYQGSDPLAVPFDTVKTLVTPLPWAFDLGTRNWDRGLYPGVWALFLAYPLAALGVWRLRRKPEVALLMVPLLLTLVMNASTSGFPFRQRSIVEPLIVVLAVAGMNSYRQAAQWGSLALGAVSLVATAQSHSPAVGVAIAACAGGLWAISRHLPSKALAGPTGASVLLESLESEPRESLWTALKGIGRAMRAAAPDPSAAEPGSNKLNLSASALRAAVPVPTPSVLSHNRVPALLLSRLRAAGDGVPRSLHAIAVALRRSALARLRLHKRGSRRGKN